MSEYRFSDTCTARVLMAGSTRTIMFAGSDVPSGLGGVLPDNAEAGVSYACRFLKLSESERESFKNFLLSNGFQ
ncbi:hypothetical protein SNQ14_002535 [Cronobacter sakazakii]|nr:hypothetical protein [Cronobacter sakazakii]ELY6147066.1 hypothetical protein [Cronobacter sakazakii]